jgi:hypothetical protein
MRDARIYNPSVANIDRTIFRNIEFVNISLTVSVLPCAFDRFSMPLNASKNAAA